VRYRVVIPVLNQLDYTRQCVDGVGVVGWHTRMIARISRMCKGRLCKD
jgi:hypothetical protein